MLDRSLEQPLHGRSGEQRRPVVGHRDRHAVDLCMRDSISGDRARRGAPLPEL
jgi:hypothetical protein